MTTLSPFFPELTLSRKYMIIEKKRNGAPLPFVRPKDDPRMKRVTIQKLFSCYPYVIALLVLLLCLAAYPLQLIGRTEYESGSLETGIFPNLDLSGGETAICTFTPSRGHLTSVSFRFLISGKAPDGSVTLELYDEQQKKLASCILEAGDVMNYRWIDFPVDLSLEAGKTYAWRLQASDYEEASLSLYGGSPDIGPVETQTFYYNGLEQETITPAAVYTYTGRIERESALPYYTAFLLLGLILYGAFRKFEKNDGDI